MSFILDALKKSEAERQRSDTPGIANIPERGARKSPSRWIWLIVGLLAINLAVIGGLLFTPEPKNAVVDSSPAAAEPEQTSTSFSAIVSEAKRSQSANVAAIAERAVQPANPAASEEPAAVENLPAGSVGDGLESFNELRAKGTLQLPDLHLDIHVYSSESSDRFVFVNMSKYKENATLDEGPKVQEITAEGVVLEYQGTTFLLPRE
jgi:general secretion pathway protein B